VLPAAETPGAIIDDATTGLVGWPQ
jgi:hypothetical protein